MQKAYNTRDSQDVSDPSTNRAQRCLTCQIGRDGVFSTWYGQVQKECRDAEEGVEKAKRAISSEKAWKRKKLAEPINYDLFKCPAKADISVEVFYNVLQFLSRNEHLQRIFNELITTKNIQLTIGLNCHNSFNHQNGNLTYLLANPGLLDFPTTFDSIELISADYNLFIDSGVLMSFVTNCNTTSRRKIKLILKGANCQATIGPMIVEEFLEHKNLENMVFNIYAGSDRDFQLAYLTKKILTERNATHQIYDTRECDGQVYELKRKDGWMLRTYMPRHIEYFVEFNIEKLKLMEEAQKEFRNAEEGVEKAKRAISSEKAWKTRKLAEPINYDLFKCPAKADILVEVFYDILQFLNRNEVEKCQLVSRFWNYTIIVDIKILPLRKIRELSFSMQKYEFPHIRWDNSVRPKFYISIAPEEIPIKDIDRKVLTNQELKHGLKNCVFEKIEGIMGEKYFKKLEEIVKTTERKILAEKACFNFVEEEFFVEKIQHLPHIFNELITTKNIQLTIGLNHSSFDHHNGNLTYLLANPGLLDFPTTFDSIELKSVDYNLFIDSGILMSFVTNCNTTSRRKIKLILSGTNCQATNGPRIVEEFLKHKNPENMVCNVYAEDHHGWQLTRLTKETLTERNATHQIDDTIAGYQREVYELKRKDGWILRAYTPRDKENFVEFNIEKL
uniref:F-box domain-containing protein n=1 Tax=Acrobeloides nanus TaxID=290746 RepID=A0A914ELA2_9BILA